MARIEAEIKEYERKVAGGVAFLDAHRVDHVDHDDIAQEWKDNLSGEIDYLIPFTGVAQDIQQWIIATSIKPQPALAFASTLAILSVVTGRRVQVNGIKGNFYSLCLAESGEGKDWPLKACQKVLDSIGMGHHVYGDMASGAALIDAMVETPSALLPIDEVGHYFASITSKTSNQFSREIMPIITKVYTSASDSYTDKKRKGQDSRKIVEPNLSVLGMSTERQIMDTLKTSEVADGSLARFLVVFGLNNVQINQNRESNAIVPEMIKSRLELLKGGQFMLSSTNIVLTKEYAKAKAELEVRFNELAINIGKSLGDKAMFKPFYYRMAVRSVQMALLMDHCIDINILHWCADIVEKSTDVFIKKFCHLAADNETEMFKKVVENAIKEGGIEGISKAHLYNKTRKVESGMKKRILGELEESGLIFIGEDKARTRPVTKYYWKK
jgi:hypothetical protein